MATGNTHRYEASLHWDDESGRGTVDYLGYDRAFRVLVAGKPELAGSADAAFHGDPRRHNPEDWLLAAIAGCHMLAYLALCARRGVVVTGYRDEACGAMEVDANGGGRFCEVTLHPRVSIARGSDPALAAALHERAHALCFIANSCAFPIHHDATVEQQP